MSSGLKKKMLGFTIAEIMMAVGIMAAVSIGVMHLVRIQNEQQVRSDTDFEINRLVTDISQHMQNSESCRSTLAALGNIKTNKVLTQIRNRSGGIIYGINTPYGGKLATSGPVIITNMELAENSADTPFVITPDPIIAGQEGHGQLTLSLTFRRDSKMINGLKSVTKYLPLSVELNSSYTVTKCYSAYQNALESAASLSCDSIKGSFNPVDNTCVLTDFSSLSLLPTDYLPPDDPSMGISTEFLRKALDNTDDITTTRFNMTRRFVNVPGDTMTGNLSVTPTVTAQNLRANLQICTSGGTRCRDFTPQSCPVGTVMVGLNANGSINCRGIALCPTNQYFAGFDASGVRKCLPVMGATCPAGQYVSKIDANGTVTCSTLSARPNVACPVGQYIRAISSSWVPTCIPVPVDTNTNVFNRGCPGGQAIRGFSSTGAPICGAY